MRKKDFFLTTTFVLVLLFAISGLYAATTVQDVIKMENPAYKKHKKSILEFTHKKHVVDYKGGCGECHHDADGNPLNELKEGDEVQNCIECHKIPGLLSKKKLPPELKKMKKKEIWEKNPELISPYHAEAIHQNCIVCHKEHNKKTKTKAAPTSCVKCHPKKK